MHHAGRTKETVREDLLYLSNKYRDSNAILRVNGGTRGSAVKWGKVGRRSPGQEEVELTRRHGYAKPRNEAERTVWLPVHVLVLVALN